jgi:glycosyltransferase involved in cell wall biosynthesis
MGVRLYGRVMGRSSHAVVTAGFRQELERYGLLEGVLPLDDYDDEQTSFGGILSRHGVFTGPLNLLRHLRRNARHEQNWAMVAPNSNAIPNSILRELVELEVTPLVPSHWAAEQLRTLGFFDAVVVPHGITPSPLCDRGRAIESFIDGQFRVLHFSTSAGQRKGTLELIQAWSHLEKSYAGRSWSERAELWCVMDPPAQSALYDRLMEAEIRLPKSVKLTSRVDIRHGEMHEALREVHLVCQPSRGEAFGLTPLEALGCGVPVCATLCTGHSEYLYPNMPGLTSIGHRELAPIDDGMGAMAPAVPVEEISRALLVAHLCWESLNADAQANATQVQRTWSWEQQLSGFIAKLQM